MGAVAAVVKRAFWPLVFLALPGVFYVWSMHSSGGTPIFIPTLPPYSYYNCRYGLAVLPLLAVASAALVAVLPRRLANAAVGLAIAAAVVPWLWRPAPEKWVVWEEAHHNDQGRREWTRQAAQYLAPRYVRGSGIVSTAGVGISTNWKYPASSSRFTRIPLSVFSICMMMVACGNPNNSARITPV